MNSEFDYCIPTTDGLGPVDPLNIRRWTLSKVKKSFGYHIPESCKVYRWVNDVLVSNGSNRKLKNINYQQVKSVLINITADYESIITSVFQDKNIDTDLPVSDFKNKVVEIIKNK